MYGTGVAVVASSGGLLALGDVKAALGVWNKKTCGVENYWQTSIFIHQVDKIFETIKKLKYFYI